MSICVAAAGTPGRAPAFVSWKTAIKKVANVIHAFSTNLRHLVVSGGIRARDEQHGQWEPCWGTMPQPW